MTTEARDYAGIAVPTKLAGPINETDIAITIVNATGWASGSNGKFFIVVDEGLSNEEHIKILSRSGTALTVATSGRGADGTTAVAHGIGADVKAVFTADDAQMLNNHLVKTTQDDHSQYVHNSIARSIDADHDFTGDPTFSGVPNFSGNPTFGGAPHFVGTPDFEHMGETGDLVAIDTGAANGGTSPKPMRADAKLALTSAAIMDIRWFPGEIKQGVSSSSAPPGGIELLGQTGLSKLTYPGTWADYQGTAAIEVDATTFRLIDGRGVALVGAGTGGDHAVGEIYGSDEVTLSVDNLAVHAHSVSFSHNVTDAQHHHDGAAGLQYLMKANSSTLYTNSGANTDHSPAFNVTATPSTTNNSSGISVADHSGNTGSAGNNVPVSVVQRSLGVRLFIRAH